jgi:metal-responsive CopG/Arc/MetJ family transcriptional regulator
MKMLSKNATKAKPATITLPSDLMAIVDEYVELHKKEGVSRSAVVEEGVRMWLQALRDKRDLDYFSKNAESLQVDDESWSKISTEAARKIFK